MIYMILIVNWYGDFKRIGKLIISFSIYNINGKKADNNFIVELAATTHTRTSHAITDL